MMKIFTLLMILLPVFGFSQLAGWNFYGVASPATLNVTAVQPSLNQSVTLTRGPGAPASTASSSFRTAGFQNNGIAVTNDDYFQFELQAATGFTMSLSAIDAQVKGTASFAVAPGVLNQFAYSTDGVTFTLIGTPHMVIGANIALPTTDLSGIAALQNVPATTTVTFRFYASGQTATGGWGFSSSTPTTENLIIDGTTAAVPCPTIPAPTASGTSTCSGGTATLTATASETGSTLSWFNVATGGTAIGTGASFVTPVVNSTTSFWVEEAVAACPESARTEVIVTVSGTAPTAAASSNSPICAGSSLNLTANSVPGATYGWTGPNSFTSAVQNPTIASATALASGTYSLTITDGGCASAVSSVTVVVNSKPTVIVTPSLANICVGNNVSLTASGANTYIWSPATGLSSTTGNTVTANPAATTTYTVTGTDANGCTGTDMVVVTVNPLPVVTVAASGLSLTASLSGATYKWINCADNIAIAGATSQTYVATANGSYKVEVTNSNGCIATSTCTNVTTVGVEAKSDLNAFSISPNPTKGKVTITASGNELANVVIFNALGQEISKASNIQNGSVIDFTSFNNGVYMVQITTNQGTKVHRVVKN